MISESGVYTSNTITGRSTMALTLANTGAKRAAFITALRNSGNVHASCRAAGIARKTAYNWRNKWASFAADWDEALEDACDILEAEARRRGMSISDRLLMFLLEAHRPGVFGSKVAIKHEGEVHVVKVIEGLDEDDL